jgi:quercetin dioxygenase-like cupin family protein
MSHLYMKGLIPAAGIALIATLSARAASAEPGVVSPEYQTYVLAHGDGLPNGLTGRLKANGRSTRGNYSVVVRESQASQAADTHTHSQLVEAWFVVEGAMTFRSGDTTIDASAGTFVLVPPGVEHGFNVAAGRKVRLVQIFSPPGFENLFSERLKLPSYDPGKEIGQQSAQWKADQKDIARKYGAGPVDRPVAGILRVAMPDATADRRALAGEADTAGRYTLEELTLAKGGVSTTAAPANDHAWYVLSGELELDSLILKPGDFAFIPRGKTVRVATAGAQAARFLRWSSQPRSPQAD